MKIVNTILSLGVVGGAALAAILTVIGISVGVACLPALVGWLLWNHALASLFHGPQLAFWQVFGVMWLASFVCSLLGKLFHS